MKGLNKFECYIKPVWKGLQGANALAYSNYLKVKNKMKLLKF